MLNQQQQQQQQQHNHSPLRLGSQRSRYSDLRSDRGDRDRGSSRISSTPPVPVLNTRMKNLSQFSFRYREHPHPTASDVIEFFLLRT